MIKVAIPKMLQKFRPAWPGMTMDSMAFTWPVLDCELKFCKCLEPLLLHTLGLFHGADVFQAFMVSPEDERNLLKEQQR